MDIAEGRHEGCFLGTLMQNLNIGAPTVSHHVKELVHAGLITTERRGKQLVCTINSAMLKTLSRAFE
jgi:predicted transcriptional regulator